MRGDKGEGRQGRGQEKTTPQSKAPVDGVDAPSLSRSLSGQVERPQTHRSRHVFPKQPNRRAPLSERGRRPRDPTARTRSPHRLVRERQRATASAPSLWRPRGPGRPAGASVARQPRVPLRVLQPVARSRSAPERHRERERAAGEREREREEERRESKCPLSLLGVTPAPFDAPRAARLGRETAARPSRTISGARSARAGRVGRRERGGKEGTPPCLSSPPPSRLIKLRPRRRVFWLLPRGTPSLLRSRPFAVGTTLAATRCLLASDPRPSAAPPTATH